MQKYERVLELMKSKGGRVQVDDADLAKILDRATGKNLVYRLTTYMSYIRRFAKLEVRALRNGRVAWAYELVVTGMDPATGKHTYQSSKYVKSVDTAMHCEMPDENA